MHEHPVEIETLTKDYGQGRGIFDVSFSLKRGECFGFLGPNGAGKSTTIRHLMGFCRPDSGKALLEGTEAFHHPEVLENVGYLPGEVSLPPSLTGREFLIEQKMLRRVKDTARLAFLIKELGVDFRSKIKNLSLGMKRKLAICAAFFSDPEILILDEPTSGLDPAMQDFFLDLVLKEKERGRTILLSSHIFSEVEHCSDRIGIIKDGKIMTILTREEVLHGGRKKYLLSFETEEESQRAKNILQGKGYLPTTDFKNALLYVLPDDKRTDFLPLVLFLHPQDLRIEKESLKELFLSYYKEDQEYQTL